jgi:hypothetical protein
MMPLERVLGVLKVESGPDASGEYVAFCCGHADRNTPNLRVREAGDGSVLLRCFAGCDQERVLAGLEERGVSPYELFPSSDGRGRGATLASRETGSAERSPEGPPPEELEGCTLEAYAQHKGLPMAFLKNLGLTEIFRGDRKVVRMPYLGEDGSEVCVRFRVALTGKPKVMTRKGDRQRLYGLWRLGEAREAGCVLVVEGESDAQTAWYHGRPAVGVPGASAFRDVWAAELEGVARLYVVVEPDAAGEMLWEKLASSPLRERLYRVELDGAKDLSELHLVGEEDFDKCLDEAMNRAMAWSEIAECEARTRMREAWESCEDLARSENILTEFADDLDKAGVVGEERAANLLYLALTSRFLEKPVSVLVKGPSSGGKSYLVEKVLGFFPESAYHALTGMSERALIYDDEPLEHRFLVIYEAAGLQGDYPTYIVRSLLSEGRVKYITVEKTAEGIRPRTVERHGPTGLILTTTAVKIHHENETRHLSVDITDTPEQTSAILKALAREGAETLDPSRWHALQEWLAEAEHRVTIPFGEALSDLFAPRAVRLRRDFGAILNLIRAHALLHQVNRERDAEGRVIATLDDYAGVRRLVADLVSEGVEATVPSDVRILVEKARELLEETGRGSVSQTELGRAMKLGKATISRRVEKAVDLGYLKNLEEQRGKKARLILDEEMPKDHPILPDIEALRDPSAVPASRGGCDAHPPPNGNPEGAD